MGYRDKLLPESFRCKRCGQVVGALDYDRGDQALYRACWLRQVCEECIRGLPHRIGAEDKGSERS